MSQECMNYNHNQSQSQSDSMQIFNEIQQTLLLASDFDQTKDFFLSTSSLNFSFKDLSACLKLNILLEFSWWQNDKMILSLIYHFLVQKRSHWWIFNLVIQWSFHS